MPTVRRYAWTLELASPPATLWPLVADTDRFNRETGVPRVERLGAEPGGLGQRMRTRVMGQILEWVEKPFDWVEPKRFTIRREYTRGPVDWLEARLTLEARGDGSLLTYEIDAQPRGSVGNALLAAQIGLLSSRRFVLTFRRFDAEASRAELRTASPATPGVPRTRCPDALRWAEDRLRSTGSSPALVALLLTHVLEAQEHEAARLRPYMLAARWGYSRRDVLELMLHATRAGVLDLRWDVMCPFCRGSKHSAGSLRELPGGVHCDACHIDFESNFDRLVELTFRPNPGVRSVEERIYCIGGPMVTPHVVMQQTLDRSESRAVEVVLRPGDHRVRTRSGSSPEADRPGPMVSVALGGPGHATIQGPSWIETHTTMGTRCRLTLVNTAPASRVFVLERLAWADEAVTAAHVTTMQTFRDLFASEALRPGERASVGSIALLFTDLKDSTRLYRQIGDAPAFGRVMSHFDVIRRVVADKGGAIVKTMGDAVMASFSRAGDAVEATLAAQRAFDAAGAESGMKLKAAVHFGPCIAVTQNDRLDYFGTSVNIAARLVGQSEPGTVAVSSAAWEEQSVSALLADGLASEFGPPRACVLRGFEPAPIQVRLLIPGPGRSGADGQACPPRVRTLRA